MIERDAAARGTAGPVDDAAPEATARERRAFVFVVGILNVVFLGLDLATPWPRGGLVLGGRIVLTILLLGVPVALGRPMPPRRVRRLVRLLAVGVVACFGALVFGTGGAAGPLFAFLGVLPIVLTIAVPDDLVAVVLAGVCAAALGLGGAAVQGMAPAELAFWGAAFACSTLYAAMGTVLHLRMRRRETQARRVLALRDRERARSEEEREALSSRLEAIRSQVNDILLLVAADGAILQANDRAVQAYGYSQQELLRMNIRELRGAATVGEVETQLRRAIGGEGLRFRTVHRRRDGSTFPAEVSSRSIPLGDGVVLQSIVRDLTEEQAARAATEYQAMLLDNLHEAVVGFDPAHAINAWNGAAERLFGWSREEALGKTFFELVPTEYADGSSTEEMVARVASAGRVRLDVRRHSRKGEWFDIAATAVALRGPDGAVIGYVSVNRDVTQRKRAEAALRASQERLRRILETSNNGIWIVDVEGRTEFMNARAAEMFGVSAEEAQGRPFPEVVPENLRDIALADLGSLQRGDRLQRESRIALRDGSEARVVVSGSVLRTPDGRIDGAVGVFMDVTALRLAQEDLQQAQKLEAVGRLAAGIAHEINTPIQYIGDNTHFLGEAFGALSALLARCREAPGATEAHRAEVERLVEELDIEYVLEQTPRTVARTLEGVKRVASIVRAMKEFAHPAQREMASADLNRALAATLEVARNEYKYVADVQTEFGELPPVTCFAGDLNQVFLNVVVNAAHAIEDVTKQTGRRGVIRVATRSEEGEVLVSISDTGCGIPPELGAKIFDPFFTTKEVGRGTGQGLAIARNIVAQHHGHLTFTSKVGEGTTFVIRLPVDPPVPETHRA